jgi:hypothetical protein
MGCDGDLSRALEKYKSPKAVNTTVIGGSNETNFISKGSFPNSGNAVYFITCVKSA